MGEKQISDVVEGREPWSGRTIREREAYRGTHRENTSPKPLARKTRGGDFCEFLQPAGIED